MLQWLYSDWVLLVSQYYRLLQFRPMYRLLVADFLQLSSSELHVQALVRWQRLVGSTIDAPSHLLASNVGDGNVLLINPDYGFIKLFREEQSPDPEQRRINAFGNLGDPGSGRSASDMPQRTIDLTHIPGRTYAAAVNRAVVAGVATPHGGTVVSNSEALHWQYGPAIAEATGPLEVAMALTTRTSSLPRAIGVGALAYDPATNPTHQQTMSALQKRELPIHEARTAVDTLISSLRGLHTWEDIRARSEGTSGWDTDRAATASAIAEHTQGLLENMVTVVDRDDQARSDMIRTVRDDKMATIKAHMPRR